MDSLNSRARLTSRARLDSRAKLTSNCKRGSNKELGEPLNYSDETHDSNAYAIHEQQAYIMQDQSIQTSNVMNIQSPCSSKKEDSTLLNIAQISDEPEARENAEIG